MASTADVSSRDVILSEAEEVIVLKDFRELIKQQDWLNVPSDDGFLLKFLRVTNYDLKTAKLRLEQHWSCRGKHPEWFSDVDPADEEIQSVIKDGMYVVCPKLDKHGRKVVIVRFGKKPSLLKDSPTEKIDIAYKAFCLIYEWVTADKNAQTNGLAFVIDCSAPPGGIAPHPTVKHRATSATYFAILQQDFIPMKKKAVHVYNQPEVYVMWTLVFSEEQDAMTKAHGSSLVGIYEDVGMEVLPDEYLPDGYSGPRTGTCEHMIAGMIDKMNRPDFKNYVKNLSSIRCKPRPID